MIKKIVTCAGLCLMMMACTPDQASLPALVPAPASVAMTGNGCLARDAVASISTPDSVLRPVCRAFADDVEGMELLNNQDDASVRVYACDTFAVAGSYSLAVSRDGMAVRAADASGAANALATVRQLLMSADAGLPSMVINDSPRFVHRGVMVDSSRHFWTVDELKSLLSTMALFKLNVLHLHLTDNQGWRLFMDKYPEVTDRGTYYYDFPERSGQFYRPDELKELVGYASARGIEIVPEVDMPGHCLALLAAKPEFSCRGGEFETYPDEREQKDRKRLGENMVCVANEAVFSFIGDLLDELVEIFPGKYIHMGGDEVATGIWETCPKCQSLYRRSGMTDYKQLQDYFTRRVSKMVSERGKVMMGWEEINDRGAADGSDVLTVWQGSPPKVLDKALERGLDVVMCPKDPCYFDYSYTRNPSHKVYAWDPACGRTDSLAAVHIRGGQACLWTEFIPTFADVQSMLFPRLCALAEVLWTPDSLRDWDSYQDRMAALKPQLQHMGVNIFDGETPELDWFHAADFSAADAEPALPATVETNMYCIKGYEKEYAFDGNPVTFYSSPYSHIPGDYFTVRLDSVHQFTSINVLSDDSRDHFTDGAELSVSADGVTFEKVAVPDDKGRLHVEFDGPRSVKAVKMELTKSKNSRLNIREIEMK